MMTSRTNPQGDLRDFLAAARSALAEHNWYAAIAVALALPDICASIDDPTEGRKRYEAWWDEYVAGQYLISPNDNQDWIAHSVLPGSDAYLLRCAYLHSGTEDLVKSRRIRDRIQFIGSPTAKHFGQSRDEKTLFLSVEGFVDTVCEGAERWLVERQDDEGAQQRMRNLISIIPSAITVVDYAKHENHERCRSAKAAGRVEVLAELDALLAQMGEGLDRGPVDLRALTMWGELSGWLRERKRKASRGLIDARNVVGRL